MPILPFRLVSFDILNAEFAQVRGYFSSRLVSFENGFGVTGGQGVAGSNPVILTLYCGRSKAQIEHPI